MTSLPITTETPPNWHSLTVNEVRQQFAVDSQTGLHRDEVSRRQAQYGRNTLPATPRRGAWSRLALQFHNPLVYALLAAGIITFGLQDYVDAGVIAGVVIINALIGFIQEGKAEKALDAVRSMLASYATVVRNGEPLQVEAADLVPGDIVLLESGAKIPADLRLLHVKNLRLNEAALTGESVPVEKNTEISPSNAALGDRSGMAFAGTVVTFGQARGLVVATGPQSEIGRISTLVGSMQPLQTPLIRRLNQFARQITLIILVAGLITFLYGFYGRNMPLLDIFPMVVGLTVAAIPEGLPAIVSIVLAIGTRVMARNQAIIRRLPAVETLGSVTVICSDKTGTLTKNEMSVVQVMLRDGTLQVSGVGYAPEGGFYQDECAVEAAHHGTLQALAQCAMLCNNAQLSHQEDGGWHLAGDPTEGALLTLARKAGLDPLETATATPRIDEIPFESEHRFMATLHHDHAGHRFMLLKGAPECVLQLCPQDDHGQPLDPADWNTRMKVAASEGQRLLALARCNMPVNTTALSMNDIIPRFTLLGLVGLIDPPRDEAIAAVAECQRAGIRVKMITGDHAVTAAAIGRQLGLRSDRAVAGHDIANLDDLALQQVATNTDIFARASPEHKLRLVCALQAQGELVAMTGDGVNDTPALKASDIGVAMGKKGTDAAREAADLVLTDDNFATITKAVREGRVVFDNIKKSLLFMLPTNGGEAGVILLAIFGGLALPVTAGQILWINMVTAVTLAIALAFEPAEPGVMQRPPRQPSEPLITRLLAFRVVYVSALMVAVTFGVFEWELARGNSLELARTAAVNMLVAGELVYLFNVRYFTQSAFARTLLTGNPVALWMSVLLIGLQLLFTHAPPMQHIFQTEPLDASSWIVIAGLAILKFLAVEAEKWVLRRMKIKCF